MGANVAGIWPKYSKTEDINAVDVNKGRKLVAAGDDFGMVKLFNGFPLTDSPKKVLKYKGHSAHVTNVRWLADGSKLISIGGADHAVFVWRLEENNDNVASEGGLSSEEAEGDVDSDVEREKLPIERRSVTKDKATAMMRQLIRSELKQEGKRRAVPPSSSLKLLHVFGYG
uniref:EML-like second beta-propeller domain-containing protein n=1 Tax=Plectus sambesii TaxID=2011161 RepID=A0A914XET8_9BILA